MLYKGCELFQQAAVSTFEFPQIIRRYLQESLGYISLRSFSMNKERQLLQFVLEKQATLKNKPQLVLDRIDKFPQGLMTIGPHKGQHIVEQINIRKPNVMIELGCYVGYSAVKFGQELAKVGGKYYSFEISQEFADIAQKVIDLAGLSDTVEILVGPAKSTLPNFAAKYLKGIDFAVIDHAKELYVPDFRILETVGLIVKDTVIVGDNIICPGAPEYHKYVNLTPQQRRHYNSKIENASGNEYVRKRSNLYESRLVHSVNDAIEITKCVGYLDE